LIAGCGTEGPIGPSSTPVSSGSTTATLVGAGDIGVCASSATEATARLLDAIPGTIFTAGDNAYPLGTSADFRDCYHPTWGRHRDRTRPSPGNHDYYTAGAVPYFEYFGAAAGPGGLGYYSFRAGEWTAFSLNSNVPMSSSSSQVVWLQSALQQSQTPCAVAYWHHPLFSSGPHGGLPETRGLWRSLYDAGVDVILNGHDHLYERFAPQDPDGRMDAARGIRQFTVGTGGAELYPTVRVAANTETIVNEYGVLKLTLRSASYTWEFIGIDGRVRDSGSGACH
jgi:hypothetical protein